MGLILRIIIADIVITVVSLILNQPLPFVGDKMIWSAVLIILTLITFALSWIKNKKANYLLLINLFVGPIISILILSQWAVISETILSKKYTISANATDYEIWINKKDQHYKIFEGRVVDFHKQDAIDIGYVRTSNDTIYFGENSNEHFEDYKKDPQLYIDLNEHKPSKEYRYYMIEDLIMDFRDKGERFKVSRK